MDNQGIRRNIWVQIVIIVLFVYYAVYFIQPLLDGEWCMLVDFCGYYSAGQIISERGISDIYDLDILRSYQEDVFSTKNISGPRSEPVAMLYLPVFIFPFAFFALFDLPVSLMLWVSINLIVFVGYLLYFSKQVSGKNLPFEILFLLLVSYPVFRNFFDGQVNVFLIICFGEFLRLIFAKKPIKSGVWLAGALIKPQLLLLLLPFLLFQKKYRVLLGFLISSIVLGAVSYFIVGWDGLLNLKSAIFEAAAGGASSFSELMMNWRAIGFYISIFTNVDWGNVIVWLGSVGTTLIALYGFRKRVETDSPMFAISLLGIIAATTAVAYHAHIHTAVIIIPFLLFLFLRGYLPKKILLMWVLIPSGMSVLQFVIGALIGASLLPRSLSTLIFVSYGSSMLIANMIVFVWALKQTRNFEMLDSGTINDQASV